MGLAKKALSPAVEARVQQVLNQTDWAAKYPKETDRMTAWLAAKAAITARVVVEVEAEQAREAEAKTRESQADLARWTNPGGRYGH